MVERIKTFDDYKVFTYELAGRPLVVKTGKVAGLANGACMIHYGETTVLATATASASPREGIDFLPLSVDYDEKLYAVGKIPGGFLKREGKPSEKAVLAGRVIDRPVRPLFPKDLRNDVSLLLTIMSVDPDCSPEITAMIGASIALSISDIPWNGPIGGVSMGLVDGKIVVNPTAEQKKNNDLELTVAASANKVVMIEAGANEVDDDTMYEAIMMAHEECKGIVNFINSIVSEIGKPKFSYTSGELDHDMFDEIFAHCEKAVMEALDTDDKNVRDAKMQPIMDDIVATFEEKYPDIKVILPELIYKIQKKIVRRWLLVDKKRVDGRRMDEIRPLASEVGVIPRVHGSGLFTRGQTQVLTIATLGTLSDAQKLEGLDSEDTKRYMHHYNMPGYSTGEAKAQRSPGRREIGHGALAERSLVPVLPSEEEFPYAIRLVSEVVSSNGSTSQGSALYHPILTAIDDANDGDGLTLVSADVYDDENTIYEYIIEVIDGEPFDVSLLEIITISDPITSVEYIVELRYDYKKMVGGTDGLPFSEPATDKSMFMLTVPNDYAAAIGLGENRKLDNLLRFDDFIKEDNTKVGKQPAANMVKTAKDYDKAAKDGYVKLREDYIHSFIDAHERGVEPDEEE